MSSRSYETSIPLQELSDQEKQDIIQVGTDCCRELYGITGTILRRRPKLKRANPDKLRYDHLQTLIGYGGEQAPDEDEIANLLADILVLLVDVKAPEELYKVFFYQVLRENEPIALPKKDEDIRSVNMGLVIRNSVTVLHFRKTSRGGGFDKKARRVLQRPLP